MKINKDRLTNVQMTMGQHIEEDMREKHDLPSEGLVIAETWSYPLRQEFYSAEDGINDYFKRRGALR